MNARHLPLLAGLATLALVLQMRPVLAQSWSGTGLQQTEPFRLDGPAVLQFHSDGDMFQAMLYRPPADDPDVVANQAAGDGSYYIPKGGTYYIKFNAIGPWTAKIAPPGEQQPAPQSPASDKRPDGLLKLEDAANDLCRSGTDATVALDQICAVRDDIDNKLKEVGWCYGQPDQAEYQKNWHACP